VKASADDSFNQLRAARRQNQQKLTNHPLNEPRSLATIPAPPPHRDSAGRGWERESGYTNSAYSNITPGADNFGEQAAGGLSGVARSVADQRARESGLEAMRNTPGYDADDMHMGTYRDSPYRQQEGPFADPYSRPVQRHDPSQSSITPMGAAAFPPGIATPHSYSTPSRSPNPSQSLNSEPYIDNPYQQPNHRYSRNVDPNLASDFDPNSIEDDGDDGLEYRNGHRGSMLSLGHQSDRPRGAGAGAASGGIIGAVGGLLGKGAGGGKVGPQYNPVQDTAYGGPSHYEMDSEREKSAWLSKQSTGSKKLRWIVGVVVVLIIIGAVVGGVLGSLLNKKNSSASTPFGSSASSDTATNGDLNKDSAEIKKLLNNKNIHKVFPGVDYTPMYTQYPDCLHYPASQNNVTRDLAVLSQMTNTIRLYGTDCNQTELLIHAVDRLDLKGKVKIWMGVWLDKNETTNARQVSQMYDILDKYGADPFVGVIIGNEVLFREDKTETEMATYIKDARGNFTEKKIDLKVASSDLGDNWARVPAFAAQVDVVMSNIHPFFAGITAKEAAGWTYDFWKNNDLPVKAGIQNHIIAETGWPSRGGKTCGQATTCTEGSVAGITEINSFMDGWICEALANGTNYFWFEAFDEPWKIKFNEPSKEWEDQWGLMDVNRNIKPGVMIPDCGGKTVPAL